MNTVLPFSDPQFKEAFAKIISLKSHGELINGLAQLLYQHDLHRQAIQGLLQKHGIEKIENIKMEVLVLLLLYVNIVLEDNYLTEDEANNIKFLKRFLKIQEGDFYRYKYTEVAEILNRQLNYLYVDNRVDNQEALQKGALQELFGLGYDQFLELIGKAVQSALSRGADPMQLDTFIKAGD